jgi:hypothetical protein
MGASDVAAVGIDLAKNAFAVDGVEGDGTRVTRAKLLEFVARLPVLRLSFSSCPHWLLVGCSRLSNGAGQADSVYGR